jgi:hypothetical protein
MVTGPPDSPSFMLIRFTALLRRSDSDFTKDVVVHGHLPRNE